MDPELECFDAQTRKAEGFGELKGGFMTRCSLKMCRQWVHHFRFPHSIAQYITPQITGPQPLSSASAWRAIPSGSSCRDERSSLDQLKGNKAHYRSRPVHWPSRSGRRWVGRDGGKKVPGDTGCFVRHPANHRPYDELACWAALL